jgi:large subunit ribosomal protein L32
MTVGQPSTISRTSRTNLNEHKTMAVPKRRQSKSRQKMRRGAKRWRAPIFKSCPECGSKVPSHIACPSCGYYRDRQVLDVEAL